MGIEQVVAVIAMAGEMELDDALDRDRVDVADAASKRWLNALTKMLLMSSRMPQSASLGHRGQKFPFGHASNA